MCACVYVCCHANIYCCSEYLRLKEEVAQLSAKLQSLQSAIESEISVYQILDCSLPRLYYLCLSCLCQ
jgi:hypothetical protein